MLYHFTDQNFSAEVLNSKEPVLVDFFAPWCGPCGVLGPIIEELAKGHEGKGVKIGKINVDESPKTAEEYGVMSVPTIIFFKGGEEVDRLVGMQSKAALWEKLTSLLAN